MFFTLAALFLIAACSTGTKLSLLPDNATILAFGDSITFGTGANPEESYPALLARLTGRRVVNAGIPGEVTAEGLTRLPEVLEREKPALLILCHGGNDLLRRMDQDRAADNLRAMIRLAQGRGTAVLLVAFPSPDLSLTPPPLYRKVAKELKVPIEEQALTTILGNGALKSDYIHPNAAGYTRLAEALVTALKWCGALP